MYLINDTDVEIVREDDPNMKLGPRDRVTFISMVHGG